MNEEAKDKLRKFLDSDPDFDTTSFISVTAFPEEETVTISRLYSQGLTMTEHDAIAVDSFLSGMHYGALTDPERILGWFYESLKGEETVQ